MIKQAYGLPLERFLAEDLAKWTEATVEERVKQLHAYWEFQNIGGNPVAITPNTWAVAMTAIQKRFPNVKVPDYTGSKAEEYFNKVNKR